MASSTIEGRDSTLQRNRFLSESLLKGKALSNCHDKLDRPGGFSRRLFGPPSRQSVLVRRLARRPDRQKGKVPSQGMGMQPHEYKGNPSSKGRKPFRETIGLFDTPLPGNLKSRISRSECPCGACGGACADVAPLLRTHPWVIPPPGSCFQRDSAHHRRGGKISSWGLSQVPVGVSSACGPIPEDLRAPSFGSGSTTP